MRRILLALTVLAGTLLAAAPADAGWGHRHCGYGGWGGGYGGYGYGGFRSCGLGYRGYGYGPYYSGYGLSVGCYRPTILFNSGCYGGGCGYGGYGYGGGYYAPRPIGYYGYYGSTYNPGSNFVGLSVTGQFVSRPAAAPASVRNILNMSREELLAALRAPAAAADAPPAARAIAAEKPAVRWSNAEQRRKAEQYLAAGDVLFREQKFHSALQRYKLASQTAPDMAETYWRQGHALVATANYELAGGAFKRAIALDADVTRGGFTLDEIYGGAAMAKQAHLESLAGWALKRSDSSESYFLMGVQLQFDGQAERAARFFDRAAELAGAGGEYLAAFAGERAAADEAPVAPVVEKKKPAGELAVSAPVEL